jgi:hypothetical protein
MIRARSLFSNSVSRAGKIANAASILLCEPFEEFRAEPRIEIIERDILDDRRSAVVQQRVPCANSFERRSRLLLTESLAVEAARIFVPSQ